MRASHAAPRAVRTDNHKLRRAKLAVLAYALPLAPWLECRDYPQPRMLLPRLSATTCACDRHWVCTARDAVAATPLLIIADFRLENSWMGVRCASAGAHATTHDFWACGCSISCTFLGSEGKLPPASSVNGAWRCVQQQPHDHERDEKHCQQSAQRSGRHTARCREQDSSSSHTYCATHL